MSGKMDREKWLRRHSDVLRRSSLFSMSLGPDLMYSLEDIPQPPFSSNLTSTTQTPEDLPNSPDSLLEFSTLEEDPHSPWSFADEHHLANFNALQQHAMGYMNAYIRQPSEAENLSGASFSDQHTRGTLNQFSGVPFQHSLGGSSGTVFDNQFFPSDALDESNSHLQSISSAAESLLSMPYSENESKKTSTQQKGRAGKKRRLSIGFAYNPPNLTKKRTPTQSAKAVGAALSKGNPTKLKTEIASLMNGSSLNGDENTNAQSYITSLPSSKKAKTKRSKTMSSRFRGVSKCSKDGRFQARIRVGNQVKYLGRFRSEEEAAKCYDNAAATLHGKRAQFNFPEMIDPIC